MKKSLNVLESVSFNGQPLARSFGRIVAGVIWGGS